jgi:hypothetical protein
MGEQGEQPSGQRPDQGQPQPDHSGAVPQPDRAEGSSGPVPNPSEQEATGEEGDLSPEDRLAAQRAATAREDREGALADAIQKGGIIPEGMDPILQVQAMEQMGSIEAGDAPASDEDVQRIGRMLAKSGMAREDAEFFLGTLQRNFTQEQKEQLRKILPERSSLGQSYEKDPNESDADYNNRLMAQQQLEREQASQLIEQAQSLAKQVETDPQWKEIDPTIGNQLKDRLKYARAHVHHKIEDMKEWLKQPPKEWLKRGFRATQYSIGAFLLFIIWYMQLIGKASKKK